MSVVIAPEFVTAAASDLANIGSTLNVANAAATAPISDVMAAGADEVSEAVAAVFGAHAQAYQAISAQADAFHQQFVQLLNTGAGSYAGAEAANTSPLQHMSGMAANAAQNIGYGNIGNSNLGFYNYGTGNVGFNNYGVSNLGFANTGYYNIGGWNSGYANLGLANYGVRNIGIGVTGAYRIGIGSLNFSY
jgi:PE family/Pentapeptide repeats (8 copies)